MTTATLDTRGLLGVLRSTCTDGGGVRAWAKAHGLSGSFVYDVLRQRKPPADSILDALGYERVNTPPLFKKKGRPDGQANRQGKQGKGRAREVRAA